MRLSLAERSAAIVWADRDSGLGRTPDEASTSLSFALIARLVMGFFFGPISDSRSARK
jgi:hypothetical protein